MKKISNAKSQNLVEGVLDSDDEDGFMARSQLYFMARDAITLHGMIDDRDDLEPWVQSKIAQSAEAIDAVRRYTEYNSMKGAEPEMDAEPDMGEGVTVMPAIDTDRYQERDGLEGPIITKSGKVVYYDPKEGQYYDPDTDMYMSYDDWKALDEGILGDLPENVDFASMLRYTQLEAEGRDEEAQQLAEALPLIPLAVAGARAAAPFIVRQMLGKGAGQIAKQAVKHGPKRAAKTVMRNLRRKGQKGAASRAAGTNAGIYGLDAVDISGGGSKYAGKASSRDAVDVAKQARLGEGDKTYSNHEISDEVRPWLELGEKMRDSYDPGDKFIDWPDHIWNKVGALGSELMALGTNFGPRTPNEAVKKAGVSIEDAKLIIKSVQAGKYIGESKSSGDAWYIEQEAREMAERDGKDWKSMPYGYKEDYRKKAKEKRMGESDTIANEATEFFKAVKTAAKKKAKK
jgi:hypothetical protein